MKNEGNSYLEHVSGGTANSDVAVAGIETPPVIPQMRVISSHGGLIFPGLRLSQLDCKDGGGSGEQMQQ